MIVDVHRTNPRRRSCISDVARLQSKKLADLGYDIVDGEEHIARHSLLHGIAINVEM